MLEEIVLELRWAAMDGNGDVWLYTHQPILHETPDGWYWDTTPDGDDYGIPYKWVESWVTLKGVCFEDAPIAELPYVLRLTVHTGDTDGGFIQ